MFKCANDECDSTIKPGDKPVVLVTKYRTVAYTDDGVLHSTGSEIVEELQFCRVCAEIADGLSCEADLVGHKVIDKVRHSKSGRLLRLEIKHYTNEEEVMQ